eukprot:IDg17716t1
MGYSEPKYALSVKKQTTNDLNAVKGQLEKVAEFHGRKELTREKCIDILHVYYYAIDIAHKEAAKSGRTVPIKSNEKTARLRGRGTKTVRNVVKHLDG